MGNREKSNSKLSYQELQEHTLKLKAQLDQTKAELNNANYLLNISQKNNQMGSWEVDLAENTQSWSENYCRLLGYDSKVKNPTQELFFSHVHEEDRDLVKEKMGKCFAEKCPCTVEFRFLTQKGDVRYARSTANFLFDENKHIVKTYGVFQDITEQRMAEKELLESKERFELAMKASQDGLFDWNLLTNAIYYSPGWKQMLGYADDELPNDFSIWENLTEPEDVKRSWEMQQKLVAKEIDRFEMEFKMKHKEGHWVDILSRSEAVFDKEGKAIRIVGTHVDVSEKNETLRILKETETNFQNTFNISPSIIGKVDFNKGKFVEANATVERILGYSVPEFLTLSITDLIHPDDIKRTGQEIEAGIKGKSIQSFENRYKCKDGSYKWMSWEGTPADPNGIVTAVGTDISERKIFADALESLASSLSAYAGEKFFANTCRYITEKANVDIAFVGRILSNENAVEVLSGIQNGKTIDPFVYELEHTPCANVLNGGTCYYPTNIQGLFPKDELLIQMGIDAYTGIPIQNKEGQPKGILVLLNSKPLKEEHLYEKLLQIFATRISVELERIEFEKEVLEAKQKAEESERKFKALYDNSPDMYVSVSPETGEILICNNTLLDKTGYTRDELMGLPVFKMYHKSSLEEAQKTFEQFVETGEVNNKELILAKKDGSKIHVSLNATAVKDVDGKILYSMSSWRDISERIKLREKRTRDRKLLDETGRLAKIGGWELDVANMTSYYSKETKRIYGIPLDAPPPKGIEGIKYYPEEVREKLQKLVSNAIEKSISYDIEIPFINHEGKHLWVRTIGIPEKKEGKVVRLYGTIQDITHQKEVEYNRHKLSTAVEQVPECVVITDTNGYISHVNPAFEKTSGYLYDEVMGKKPNILNSGYHDDAFFKNMWDTISSGHIWEGEFCNKRKNEEIYWERASITPVKNKDGEITDYIAIKEDITEKKRMFEELRRAKEQAEESDRLKSAFLANMSHEIRTPMNGIIGFTELLQDPNLPKSNQTDYLKIIQKSTDRLLNTVNDIIEISKIESGQVTMNASSVDVNDLLENLVLFFTPEAEQKGLKLIIENKLGVEPYSISVDKTKFSSILSNLIKNAIKYTSKGHVKVGFHFSKDEILFFCEDTGIGIPVDRQEAVFRRFEQADIEDKRVHEGTGLGLAIVKSYADMLEGEIHLESTEDKGSVFSFVLPVEPTEEQQKQQEEEASSRDKNKDIHVLIVEDDEFSAIHLAAVVEELTSHIDTVSNGIDAIKMCREDNSIDVILMDIKMPYMSGFEATEAIRSFNKNVKIIAQTAFAFEEDKKKALAVGCNDYISKPIKREKLIALIQSYF